MDTGDRVLSCLRDLRESIDNIDAAIVHMLAERFRCTRAIGELKAQQGLPLADPGREAEQIGRLGISPSAASSTRTLLRSFSTWSFGKSFGITNRFDEQSPKIYPGMSFVRYRQFGTNAVDTKQRGRAQWTRNSASGTKPRRAPSQYVRVPTDRSVDTQQAVWGPDRRDGVPAGGNQEGPRCWLRLVR
jgi:monofunctional chorismate mutase